jgi:hypothetical protein
MFFSKLHELSALHSDKVHVDTYGKPIEILLSGSDWFVSSCFEQWFLVM